MGVQWHPDSGSYCNWTFGQHLSLYHDLLQWKRGTDHQSGSKSGHSQGSERNCLLCCKRRWSHNWNHHCRGNTYVCSLIHLCLVCKKIVSLFQITIVHGQERESAHELVVMVGAHFCHFSSISECMLHNAGYRLILYVCMVTQGNSPEETIPASLVPDEALPMGRTEPCKVTNIFGDYVIWYIHLYVVVCAFPREAHVAIHWF